MKTVRMVVLAVVTAGAVALAQGRRDGAPGRQPDNAPRGGRGADRGAAAERPPAMQERMQAAWAAVDKEACFKALDTDADGVVSQEEFERADMGDVFGKALADALRKQAREAAGGDGAKRAAGAFERMDKNGDGAVTADEFPRGAEAFEQLLKRADTNGDGMLSKEELDAMRAKAQERGAGGRNRQGDNPAPQAAE